MGSGMVTSFYHSKFESQLRCIFFWGGI